jgi:hypothetical protein
MTKSIINKKYRISIDTSTIMGKIERTTLDVWGWDVMDVLKHSKHGELLDGNNEKIFNSNSILKLKWRYDKYNKNIIHYDFYIKLFNKYIYLHKLRYDTMYVDKHSNIIGKGFAFDTPIFDFRLDKV